MGEEGDLEREPGRSSRKLTSPSAADQVSFFPLTVRFMRLPPCSPLFSG